MQPRAEVGVHLHEETLRGGLRKHFVRDDRDDLVAVGCLLADAPALLQELGIQRLEFLPG
eukprot:CAMPEP_0179313460 /NCGR_PEP_ID=MMETSP0797-20121207/53842_1 /TAXON_ID=47934 /ORGANISM="Dinophysis acuminata, Strain DAEP01" /LENGTH=59 /DNA_ID=CAMNT_0021023523 /DNA_START=73 /DNA_END=249 /DNA_ORIENTATION=-